MDKSDEVGVINTVGGAAERAIAGRSYAATTGRSVNGDEIIVEGERTSNFDDVVSGAFGFARQAARARQSGRAQQTADQAYRLNVGRFSAQQGFVNALQNQIADKVFGHDLRSYEQRIHKQLGPGDVTYGNGSLGFDGLGFAGYVYGNIGKAVSNTVVSDIEFFSNLANTVQGRGHLRTDLSFAKFGSVDPNIRQGMEYAQYAAGAKGLLSLGKLGLQAGGRFVTRTLDDVRFDNLLSNADEYKAFGAADEVKVNLNSNDAVSEFGVYEIEVFGELHKVGKADVVRITKSSGLPTRLHQQLRNLRDIYGRQNVLGNVTFPLGRTTTLNAKSVETRVLQDYYNSTGKIPVGNQKSFRPKGL